mmetsp:Transcript_7078/g.15115  ORF Transcript_7078/g.15115 Transcript_7078/m.15115 type:complete len:225 (+) Transcript_7078:129-803(+)
MDAIGDEAEEEGSIGNVLRDLGRVHELYDDMRRLTSKVPWGGEADIDDDDDDPFGGTIEMLVRSKCARHTPAPERSDAPPAAKRGRKVKPTGSPAHSNVSPFSTANTANTANVGPAKAAARPSSSRSAKRALPRSNYCHVCARTGTASQFRGCKEYNSAIKCRKVYCDRCVVKSGVRLELMDASQWLCFHCRNSCPVNARCQIYSKVNAKRGRTKPSTALGEQV